MFTRRIHKNLWIGTRPAFSLIELMIAIVILGLGMVMVATMFPVALGRARKLTESTRQASINDGADTVVNMVARVDGLNYDAVTFAGDLWFDKSQENMNSNPPYPGALVTYSDTRVHYLHMENLSVFSLNRPPHFVPNRAVPWTEPFAPWLLERLDFQDSGPSELIEACDNGTIDYCFSLFISSQVRFESRVYPPMPPRKNVSPEGEFDPAEPDIQWDDTLNTRRYAWGIFHRLHHVVGPRRYEWEVVYYLDPPANTMPHKYDKNLQAQDAADSPREFDIYYVTLRRPQSTLRYARQEPATAPNPFVLTPRPEVEPKAVVAEFDVLLPEPWRVQIQLPQSLPNAADATGIPTVIEVPPPDISAGANHKAMLTQMFQQGSPFIDEITGQVYRVIKYQLDPSGQNAYLTLDREITVADVEVLSDPALDPPNPTCQACIDVDNNGVPVLDDEERLRTVWVFPPPVQQARLNDGSLVFDGPQPVIGIDIRPLTISPRR